MADRLKTLMQKMVVVGCVMRNLLDSDEQLQLICKTGRYKFR